VEAAGFDARTGAWEGGGKNNGAAEGEGVGSMRFSGIDFDPFESSERLGIKPAAVGEKRVASQVCHGGFEMEAARDGHRDDFVVVRGKARGELANAFVIRPAGKAREKFSADAENVAALHSAGEGDVFELAKFCERLSERLGFTAARFGSERQNHGKFIEDDGGIFNEHGVGKIRFSRERVDAGAKFFEQRFVRSMLRAGFLQIDGLALHKSELAMDDRGTYGARDGSKHSGRKSLHENAARR